MSNPAQDEYNRLIHSSTHIRPSHHRHDSSSTASSSPDLSDVDDNSFSQSTRPSTQNSRQPQTRSKSIRSSTAIRPRSKYPNDSDDSSDLDSAPEEETQPSNGKTKSRSNLPSSSRLAAANTGPKGVITDAWAAEREAQDIAAAAAGGRARVNGIAEELETQNAPAPGEWERGAGYVRSDDEDDLLDEDDSENEEYMRQWRAARRSELLNTASAKNPPRTTHKTHRAPSPTIAGSGGGMPRVAPLTYLSVLETTPSDTAVLVYIADDDNPLSRTFSQHLASLSHKHTHVRFISMSYEDAEIGVEGVPALLAYRAGEQVMALVPLMEEVRVTCNLVSNLEGVLGEFGVL